MENQIVVKIELTNKDVAYIMEVLNRSIQGRDAAKLLVPIMDKLEEQSLAQIQEIAFARKEAEKKLNEAQPKVED